MWQNCALRNPISKYLWNQFSASTQEVLTSATSTPEEQKLALVQALDNILKGVLIYETVRFAGVALSPETLALRSQNPKGKDLIRLNRLLLEDAYPLEIAKSQAERWIVNPKEMALAINSVVPLNKVEALATYMRLVETGIEEKAKHMAIAPMGIESNLTSACSISITRDDGQPLERDSFQVRPIWKPMPAGLWGKPNLTGDRKHLKPPNLNGAQLVENTLTGFEVRPVEKCSSLFSVGDFIDLAAFVAKLRTQDPISNYLWNQFSASTREVLTSATSTPEEQKLALVQALDNILKGVLIYETVRFARVALSPETLALRSQNPKGKDLIRLNRLLLEDAYPLEIAKSQPATCHADREDLQYTTELIKDAYGWREFQSSALRGRAAWDKAAKTAVSRRDERDQLLKALGLVNPVIDLGEPMDQGILLAA